MTRPTSAFARRLLAADRRGIAAVEFALLAPILCAILVGITVWGLFFATQIAVAEAANEGARASVAGLTASERVSLATAAADRLLATYAPLLKASSATVTAAPQAANPALFQITVSYPFTAAGFTNILPTPGTSATATVVVSNGGY